MEITKKHCLKCEQELANSATFREGAFFFCKNQECPLFGVQQLSKETVELILKGK